MAETQIKYKIYHKRKLIKEFSKHSSWPFIWCQGMIFRPLRKNQVFQITKINENLFQNQVKVYVKKPTINKNFPTYKELELDFQARKASLVVDRINHREFIKDGIRYFCGWSSIGRPVQGWVVYKAKFAVLCH